MNEVKLDQLTYRENFHFSDLTPYPLMLPLVNSLWIGAILFALGAIFLTFVLYALLRRLLGPHVSKDTAPLSTSLITRLGALHALILALMFAQEMQNYLGVGIALTKEATAIADVYYTLENYNKENPETTASTRVKIVEFVQTFLDREKHSLAVASMDKSAWERYTQIEQDLLELQVKNDYQKDMRSDMIKDWDLISDYRRSYQAASARKIPSFFWVMAVLGFAFITIPFHAFKARPSNLTVMSVFAAFNGIVIYFIYAMNNPFTGAAPIEPVALEQLYTEFMVGHQGK